ncbi:bifunctional coenzyme A synthase [Lucilia sericata]|uniref:bifunctional coenzyme A synthase n=1 Tax=Lucilia sericata TaxID=13632 RepID=UPI0018A86FA9|nr:bifunctional coenzyme A synthase [Lucilia sericata]
MASTGLLVVSNVKKFAQTLHSIEKYVHSVYVHLNVPVTRAPVPSWGRLISQLYVDSSVHFNNKVDMNILVTPLKQKGTFENLNLRPIDMIFSDAHHPEVCEKLRQELRIEKPTIYLADESCNDLTDYQQLEPEDKIKMYNNVVLGGTFDRIHLGHKIFLTQAVIRACCRLVVGVTTSQLTKSKTLNELILPVDQRIDELQKFLKEIDATLEYEVVPIDDPFGPTKNDPNMDMIVVSAETLRGGQKVNEVREGNKLNTLDIFCIDLVEATDKGGPKEHKVSSSNTRIDILGTRWRQPEPKPHLPAEPYIVGLTGGIASGKSKMAQRFANMGAYVMDCDKIAHEIYEPGQVCYKRVVEYFGQNIVDNNGRIDRSKLGPIVFANPSELEKLNNIVWPELMAEVKRRLKALSEKENPPQVVILEAAVLLKAGWEQEVHEVWSMIVPPEEAVKRVIERNGLTEEEAKRRLASQMSNDEMVAKSHVIFCSLWDTEFTLKQAEKAWNMLKQEWQNRKLQTSSL